MKKVVVCAIVAVVGFILGAGYSRMEVRKNGEDVRIDTVFIENKISVSKEELAESTTEIAPPKTIKETEYIYIPEVKVVEKIVKDTVFLSIPRQYYFTESNGVLIWHSGIQSRIDSLDYTERKYVIEKVSREKMKKNYLSLGAEVGYFNSLYSPIYLEYERMLHKNVGIYGKAIYDLPSQNKGAVIGVRFRMGW